MKEKSLDHHEKETHRGRHLDFDIRCIASKTAVSTDFSFIFSFDVEILDPGFHKLRLFLEMLSSIGLDLSVSLRFFDEEFILPFPIESMLFKEALMDQLYVFRYKSDQVFKWVAKLFSIVETRD